MKNDVKLYLSVGIGGMIGAMFRYAISLFLAPGHSQAFPWGTLIVNIVGAFSLAFILFHPYIKKKIHPLIFIAFTTGLLGAFTTFSTIIVEITLLSQGTKVIAVFYFLVTFIGGIFSSYLGYRLSRKTKSI